MTHHVQRLLVACAALLTAAHAAAAQQGPPPDSSGPRLLLNEVFPVNSAIPGYVVLMEGAVYRVELEPGSAALSIRAARRPTLPPVFLVPISNEALPEGSSVYLMVPRTSEECRPDLTALGDEPVRVRHSLSMVRRPVLGWEIEGAVVNARSLPGAFDPRRVSTVTVRLGAGVKLRS